MMKASIKDLQTQLEEAKTNLGEVRVKAGVSEAAQTSLEASLAGERRMNSDKSDELALLKMEARNYQSQLTVITAELQVQKVVAATKEKEILAAGRVALAEKEYQAELRAEANAKHEASIAQLKELHSAQLKGEAGEAAAAQAAQKKAEEARAALAQEHGAIVSALREDVARHEGAATALRAERAALIAERDGAVSTSLATEEKLIATQDSITRLEEHTEALRKDLRSERGQKDAVRVECDMMLQRVSRAAAKQDARNQRLVGENRMLMERLQSSETSLESSSSRARHEFDRANAERMLRIKHTAAELSLKRRLETKLAAERGDAVGGALAAADEADAAEAKAAETGSLVTSPAALELLRAMPPPGSFASPSALRKRTELDSALEAAEQAFSSLTGLPPAMQPTYAAAAVPSGSPSGVRTTPRGAPPAGPLETPPPPGANFWRVAVDPVSRRQYAYNPRTRGECG
jgi:hypothetical protein